jgi:transcriptional regulator with GAF, ATPase, and Fis domain
MKDIRFNISLYVIIPTIFAGIALLASILSYNITTFYLHRALDPEWPVTFWASIMIGLTFGCGLLIVKILIDPVDRFAQKTEQLGVVQLPRADDVSGSRDEMARYAQLFDQVTELLSRVEAKELFPEIVGQSKAMRGVFNQILKIAPSDATVLLLGETGTGKELIAQSIHKHSRRRNAPFIAINCAAIPEGLLESELFGHEKGAFTGATHRKAGKFEMAQGGTIFLDEIGDMPLATQAKILRVLQDSLFERLGGNRTIRVDVRFIAATNQDLSAMVESGNFRQDLFFRLNVIPIMLPPLIHRREDIPLLAERFLHDLDREMPITSPAMQLMMGYEWPGNVRELKNTIEAAAVMATDNITSAHLPAAIGNSGGAGYAVTANEAPLTTPPTGAGSLKDRLQAFEKGLIIDALRQAHGVQKKAAQILGIKERSLWHRVKKFELDASQFKHSTPESAQ